MTTELMKNENELVELEGIKITRGEIELVKRTIFIGANDDELRLFFYECRRRGVHPMDRLIYPVARKDKEGNRHVTFQMGIDYLRAAGEETGRYIGQKTVQYGPLIKQVTDEGEISVPEWAEAFILRKDAETGEIAEIPHRVRWAEYYPGQKLGHMWRKMPFNQLAKCAEAGALRKAFPRKLGGLYLNEEMEQAEAVPFTPIQMPQEKKQSSEKSPTNRDTISEAQAKRFYAIAKSTKATDDQIKEWIYREYNIEHTKDILKYQYDEICTKVKEALSDEPGAKG
jgi:phage recombination protein Bet